MSKVNADPLRDVQQEEPSTWKDGNEVYEWEMEEENDTVRN